MEITFSGTLFILIESQTYQYHQGKDFNVPKMVSYNEAKNKESSI